MNTFTTSSSDHSYAHNELTAPDSVACEPESPSISIICDDDADETLKADEYDEIRNEATLVGTLLQKIFQNRAYCEEQYMKEMDEVRTNESKLQQQLIQQNIEIDKLIKRLAETEDRLAKSEYQREKLSDRLIDVHFGLSAKLSVLRETSYDFYLVMNYALEKFFDRFNERSELEVDEPFSKPEAEPPTTVELNDKEEEQASDAQTTTDEEKNDNSSSNDDESPADDQEDQDVEMVVLEPVAPPKSGILVKRNRKTEGDRTKDAESSKETRGNCSKPCGSVTTLRVIHPKPNVQRMFEKKIKKIDGCKKCSKIESKPKLLVHLQQYHKMSPVLSPKPRYNDFQTSRRSIEDNISATKDIAPSAEAPQVSKMKLNISASPSPKTGKRKVCLDRIGSDEPVASGSGEKKKKRVEEKNTSADKGKETRFVIVPNVRKM